MKSLSQMFLSFLLVIIAGPALGPCSGTSVKDSVIAVSMLFRHGDRAPINSYPTDPYANYPWTMGFGALTPKGIRELYKAGMVKADRYEALLKGQHKSDCFFGPQNIYMVSSSSGRCIMSAESFLDGLLPSLYRQIPINVPPEDEDTMLVFPGKPCKAYLREFAESYRLDRPEVLALTENGAFVDYVANHTGQEINDLATLLIVADTLGVQIDNGLAMPAWAAGVYYTYFEPLSVLTFQLMSTTNVQQIRSGVLMQDIIDRFDKFLGLKNETSVENVLLYSAHDLNVQSMLTFMEVFDQVNTRPSYASTISWELRNRGNVKKGVEIAVWYYRNDSDENPLRLNIPGCPIPCSYETFKQIYKPKLVSNYDRICQN